MFCIACSIILASDSIECLRCWLLHGERSALVMPPGGGGGALGQHIGWAVHLCIWEFGPLVTIMIKYLKMIPLTMTKI